MVFSLSPQAMATPSEFFLSICACIACILFWNISCTAMLCFFFWLITSSSFSMFALNKTTLRLQYSTPSSGDFSTKYLYCGKKIKTKIDICTTSERGVWTADSDTGLV